jgi:hypothetical protein
MQIGDWSDDGHGHCEDFFIESNKPVEEVREAHFLIKDKTEIDIEKLCSEYEEAYLLSGTKIKLRNLGYDLNDFEDMDNVGPEEMARLWVFLLNKVNPDLELELVVDDIPTLNFYGFDDKHRHIGHVGYGCFND